MVTGTNSMVGMVGILMAGAMLMIVPVRGSQAQTMGRGEALQKVEMPGHSSEDTLGQAGCPADLNLDAVVEQADLALLLGWWGHCSVEHAACLFSGRPCFRNPGT